MSEETTTPQADEGPQEREASLTGEQLDEVSGGANDCVPTPPPPPPPPPTP